MSTRVKKLPIYTLFEELCNSISHGIGALLGVAALVLCLVKTLPTGDFYRIFSSFAYGISLIILYTISTVYHALKRNKGKAVMRILDHCSIYFLIAGSYTPFSLVLLRSYSEGWGWAIFCIVWIAGILGITLNAISLERFKIFSMICYLAMGWAVVIAVKPLLSVFSGPGLALMVWGGVAYTLGAILYGIGAKMKYFHSIFHLFVVAGSVLHFFSIYLYVL